MKASRETVVLIAVACATTFVLSYHARTTATPEAVVPMAVAQEQVWTGHLAEVAPATVATPVEPLSSASLVVPKSALALPAPPRKIPAKSVVPVPPTRNTIVASITPAPAPAMVEPRQDHSLLHTLNPINHLPDMASVRRPFASAGEAVAGWFRRF